MSNELLKAILYFKKIISEERHHMVEALKEFNKKEQK